MARTHVAVAVTAACMALIATLSLIQVFGTDAILANFPLQLVRNSDHDPKHPLRPNTHDEFVLGVGKADITGPVVEINFMGYADPNQVGSGLRQRLYSRAFIIGTRDKPTERIVYVVQDIQSGDTAIRQGILDGLRDLGKDYSMYDQQNVAITGTHSHSGPGAWLNYLLPQITSKGFNKQSYDAIVQGTLRSIKLAHESMQSGNLAYGQIRVPDTNINRSPYAYNANPESERDEYQDSVDKELSMLTFHSGGKDLGILTWFPVHGTSMLGNNTFVTGDNKGVAANMFERYARRLPTSSSDFVAGFSQANVGDTSPNVLGAWCESGPQEGSMCDFKTSLCGGKTQPCHGRGPHWGLDDAGTASNFEIGRRQYVAARALFESMQKGNAGTSLAEASNKPVVKSLHVFVDFANRTFTLPNGTEVRTCPAALGYSFAAGTTDGPGAFDFKQHNPGDPDANPLWETVRNQLHQPGPDQIQCHGAKPILLDVGETTRPYLWTPNIVDIQFLRIGSLFVIVSPGEATTMAGRRWKSTLLSTVTSSVKDIRPSDQAFVVLGGPANSYTHYIATPEEYDIQRYEGASTLYGPHTLDAYLDLTSRFVPFLAYDGAARLGSSESPQRPDNSGLDPGPSPPIHTNISLSFINPVVRDSSGFFNSFGDVIEQPKPAYELASRISPVVEATFTAANPRNNLRLEGSFIAVERYNEHTGLWSIFRDDSDWSTVFAWTRTNTIVGTSTATVRWELGWELGSWGSTDENQQHFADIVDSAPPNSERRAKNTPRTNPRGLAAETRGEALKDFGQNSEMASKSSSKPASAKLDGSRYSAQKLSQVDEGDQMEISGSKVRGYSDDYVTVDELRGRYRLRYRGDAKSFGGSIEAFEGLSKEFLLV
ncbi:hypothetical protein C1H76_6894 [Elsinoe australis]|uniref:Neutral ceramidase n=1 Tax=Elsinoe australis TaxID=40998 RepID=A0A4U7B0L1_9PEZI|nr:hypothetical protein C1H76_6894 [Elsinoe australis]